MSSAKRALLLTPLAAGGCVTTHYSEGGTTWGDAMDSSGAQQLPPLSASADELIRRWQLPPDSPWSAFSKPVLPTARNDFEAIPVAEVAQSPERCAADEVAANGVPAEMMWLVDLPGAQSVRFTAELSRAAKEPIAPVLTFNNWPAEDELIPTRTVLSALAAESPKLPAPGVKAAPVFALDSDRLAFAGEEVEGEKYDNRYILTEPDLPGVELLKQQGITRVVYLVADKNARSDETDDLNPLLLAYQAAGLEISLVDLNDLCELQPPPAPMATGGESLRPAGYGFTGGSPGFWEPWLFHHAYWVRVRPLKCNLAFFHRAHGGFGGRRAFEGFGHSGFGFSEHSHGGGFHASGGFGTHGGGGGFHGGFGSHGLGGFGHGGFGGHGGGG